MTRRRPLKMLISGLLVACSSWCPTATAQRSAADAPRRQRPVPEQMRIENLSPELEQILRDWEQASSRIQTLQGKHRRFVYDTIFHVEKRADGVFYYKSPDKGRIDILEVKVPPDAKSRRIDPKTGQPYKLQSDRPERWVCTGQEILQINDAEKTVQRFPIPPHVRGENIMEGPLPFLFGMPAKQAKRRYKLKLLKAPGKTQIWLAVQPRWKQDAANWQEATVILEKPNYLPSAVRLIDPSGNLETVYSFSELKVNKPKPFFAIWRNSDPFQPDLRRYKMLKTDPPVPSVLGTHWKEAQAALKKAGYKVKFHRGIPAKSKRFEFAVYSQQPPPATPLKTGGTVELTLYDKPVPQTSQKSR